MSDDTTTTTDTTTADVDKGGNSGYTPPASQEELNRIIADRISREKAKFADYGDLKEKASKFDELSESQKTELQKATDRAVELERELQTERSEKLRLSVLAKHQIPEDYQSLVTGATEEELTESAQKVAALVTPAQQDAVRELVVPGEGRSPATALNGDGLEAALKAKLGIA